MEKKIETFTDFMEEMGSGIETAEKKLREKGELNLHTASKVAVLMLMDYTADYLKLKGDGMDQEDARKAQSGLAISAMVDKLIRAEGGEGFLPAGVRASLGQDVDTEELTKDLQELEG